MRRRRRPAKTYGSDVGIEHEEGGMPGTESADTNSRRAFVRGAAFAMFAAIPVVKALASPRLAFGGDLASSHLHSTGAESLLVHPMKRNYAICESTRIVFAPG
jgi:hypothetical protein